MHRLLVALSVLSALVLVALAACSGSTASEEQAASAPATDPHGIALPGDVRTILLSRVALPASPAGDLLNARLEAGSLPAAELPATVVSDTECTPDAAGISHCRNELRLRDGTILVARHSHRMAEVPCLSPGEEVRVRPV